MQTVTREYEVFEFEELDERAQEKAYSKWAEYELGYEWWHSVYEDFKAIGETFGLVVTDISFELYSGADGAAFAAGYDYVKGCKKAIREYAPMDEELHDIVDRLVDLQRLAFYQLVAQSSIPAWRNGMTLDVEAYDNYIFPGFTAGADARMKAAAEDMREIFADLAHWLYKTLRAEYDYLISMESFLESIEVNEWKFYADGSIF